MRRSLSLLAVIEAIAMFGLLFAVADDSSLAALGVIAAILLLCVVALRLVGTKTFSWFPQRGAVALLALLNTGGVVVALGVLLS